MHSNKAGSKNLFKFHFSTVVNCNYVLLAKKETEIAQISTAMVSKCILDAKTLGMLSAMATQYTLA